MKYLNNFNENNGYREVPEDNVKHCETVEKFMKYFSTKMMNKQAWWINSHHLPKIDGMSCDSISYNKEKETYDFGPNFSGDKWIWEVPKDNVPPSIRSIMEKSDCSYISLTTSDHNYGCLMYYKTSEMSYSKSLDPVDVDKDEFAQYILETLVDQTFDLKNTQTQ